MAAHKASVCTWYRSYSMPTTKSGYPQNQSWDILNIYENTQGRFKSLLQQCHGISFTHWSMSTLEEFMNAFGLRHVVWERHRWFYHRNKVEENFKQSSKTFVSYFWNSKNWNSKYFAVKTFVQAESARLELKYNKCCCLGSILTASPEDQVCNMSVDSLGNEPWC